MESGNPEERRTFPRHFVRILVDFSSTDSFLYDYSNDLSEGGVFIQTTNPLEPGEQMNLRFTLPGTDRLFQLKGEVAWVHKKQNPNPAIDSEEALGDALDDLLDGVSEMASPEENSPEESEKDEIPEGMGIRFVNITEEEKSLLRDFLQKESYGQ